MVERSDHRGERRLGRQADAELGDLVQIARVKKAAWFGQHAGRQGGYSSFGIHDYLLRSAR
jgi:hypothetical protein